MFEEFPYELRGTKYLTGLDHGQPSKHSSHAADDHATAKNGEPQDRRYSWMKINDHSAEHGPCVEVTVL